MIRMILIAIIKLVTWEINERYAKADIYVDKKNSLILFLKLSSSRLQLHTYPKHIISSQLKPFQQPIFILYEISIGYPARYVYINYLIYSIL